MDVKAEIERLFRQSKEIEVWLKAHWNSSDVVAIREMKRRMMEVLDEIKLILDTNEIKEL
ncbi:MAG: hypothetical protein EPN37_10315 [Chitinophagaceae bacterium]|nr:MAG: hypothetical protein EPN37_10315 [Chitinophagaceae bacterium]